ncbi:DNA-packaging protein [Alicyclobacillus contaminans]|uniref:head-tail connector protein n=1 Tax=Alicyclobacillus contaminans TaxID=392016 RepID=UPI0004278FA2|nr:head-tail connector protein [Alicyclobacillus contaminans]GMA48659.1 DNA-packaging protein [Alicyclobacillus contaminans]GMA52612.1 DNA-packaging protein [Alicyclobacillus contaminans]
MTLDDVKLYLRIDGTDDDAMLQGMMGAADSYIANAVGADVDKTSALYELAAKLLISHWYENREPVGSASALAFSLDSILMQLRYTLPDATTDTSGDTP